jgi:hypothetical protein
LAGGRASFNGVEQPALPLPLPQSAPSRGRLQDDGLQFLGAQGHATQAPSAQAEGPAPDFDSHSSGQQYGQLGPGLDALEPVANVRVAGALDQQDGAVAGVNPENVADAEQVALTLDTRQPALDRRGQVAVMAQVCQGAGGRGHVFSLVFSRRQSAIRESVKA